MLSNNMVSITECKKILKKERLKYTDEEIQSIKELLELFVQSSFKLYKEQQQNEKSSNNVSCEQRRASKRV